MGAKERWRKRLLRWSLAVLDVFFLLLVPWWLIQGPLSTETNFWIYVGLVGVMMAGLGILCALFLVPLGIRAWNVPPAYPIGPLTPNPTRISAPRIMEERHIPREDPRDLERIAAMRRTDPVRREDLERRRKDG